MDPIEDLGNVWTLFLENHVYIFLILHTTLGTLWPHSGRDGRESIQYLLPFFLSKSTPILLGDSNVPAQIQTQFPSLSWSLQWSVESVGKIFPAKVLNRNEPAGMHTFALAFTLSSCSERLHEGGGGGQTLWRWRQELQAADDGVEQGGGIGPDESWILDQLFPAFLCERKMNYIYLYPCKVATSHWTS